MGSRVHQLALLAALGALGGACDSRPGDAALRVLVTRAPGLRSACLTVRVSQDGGIRHSAGLPLDGGQAPLVVAVYEDGLGAEARVQALGFAADCQTSLDPPEGSPEATARFGYPEPTELSLVVGVLGVPDGGPPDGGPPDAGPPDAGPPDAGPPCPGTPVSCQGPVPGCQQRVTCPDGSCVLRPAPAGGNCDDGRGCTTGDVCDGDGGCLGAPRTCPDPGVACLAAVCVEPAGCGVAADPLASCTDLDPCTENDACLGDGGCAGTPVVCAPPGECQTALGCSGGACGYAAKAGPCDGGTCNGLGQCVPPTLGFPYVPSNFTEGQLPPLSPAPLTVSCAVTVTTRTADGGVGFSSACGTPTPSLTVLPQGGPGGPEAALLYVGPLTIDGNGFLTAQGARPLLVVVQGSATVAGVLVTSAGADLSCAAQPQGTPFDGATPGGGGGGGFGSAGSGGGISNRGGVGQGTSGTQALVPLRGGCSGGLGGPTTAAGAGGGAVQVSATGTVQVDGVLSAPGGAGDGAAGGAPVFFNPRGGGGGGSGGGILLEGLQVVVGHGGAVAANGGGGGEGSDAVSSGASGQPGTTTTTSAPGGTGSATCGAAGGRGAARSTGSASGSAPANGNPCFGVGGGGGGGGGVGRIRLNAMGGCTLDGVLSPAPTGC